MVDEILTIEIQSEPTIEIDLEDIEVIETPRAVDTEMSDASENPVQNKVIKSYVDARLDKNYVHTQIAASNNWTITHNLNKYPAITIVDSGGTVVIGEVEYINLNLVYVKFNGVFSGKAYCN